MKRIFTLLTLLLFVGTYSIAQSSDDEGFTRKGRFLVETGYNIVGGLSNSTGANIQIDFDGGSVTALGLDMGKFLSEDFALKFRLGLLSSNGFSITNVTGGFKYYAGGKVPIELTAGLIDGGGSVFTGNFKVGYAANLADNITLEPSIGVIFIEDESALNLGFSFSLFL